MNGQRWHAFNRSYSTELVDWLFFLFCESCSPERPRQRHHAVHPHRSSLVDVRFSLSRFLLDFFFFGGSSGISSSSSGSTPSKEKSIGGFRLSTRSLFSLRLSQTMRSDAIWEMGIVSGKQARTAGRAAVLTDSVLRSHQDCTFARGDEDNIVYKKRDKY